MRTSGRPITSHPVVPRTQTMKPPTTTGIEYQLTSEISVSLQPRPIYPLMYYQPISHPVSLQEHSVKISDVWNKCIFTAMPPIPLAVVPTVIHTQTDIWNKCIFTATPPIPLAVVPTDMLSIYKLTSGMAAALRSPRPILLYTSFFLSLPSSTYSFLV
jgi:hypothetical protein